MGRMALNTIKTIYNRTMEDNEATVDMLAALGRAVDESGPTESAETLGKKLYDICTEHMDIDGDTEVVFRAFAESVATELKFREPGGSRAKKTKSLAAKHPLRTEEKPTYQASQHQVEKPHQTEKPTQASQHQVEKPTHQTEDTEAQPHHSQPLPKQRSSSQSDDDAPKKSQLKPVKKASSVSQEAMDHDGAPEQEHVPKPHPKLVKKPGAQGAQGTHDTDTEDVAQHPPGMPAQTVLQSKTGNAGRGPGLIPPGPKQSKSGTLSGGQKQTNTYSNFVQKFFMHLKSPDKMQDFPFVPTYRVSARSKTAANLDTTIEEYGETLKDLLMNYTQHYTQEGDDGEEEAQPSFHLFIEFLRQFVGNNMQAAAIVWGLSDDETRDAVITSGTV